MTLHTRRAMRIVFFTAFAIPHKGGVERHSLALARRLAACGHRVTIVTCNTERVVPRETVDGVDLIRLPAWVLAEKQFPVPVPARTTLQFLRELKTDKPDIIAAYTRFYVTSLLAFSVARWLRRPMYHIECGSRTYKGSKRMVNAFAWLVDRTWGRVIVRRADRLFAASEDVGRFVRSLGASDAHLLPPRVDASLFRPNKSLRSEWRRGWGVQPDQVVILSCGRLVRTKGVLDLDEAFGKLGTERAVLVFVGDGPDRSQIIESERVRCLGELDDAGVVGALNAADVFVNPSHSEGLPTSVLEAAAVGLPVVATDVGGTREIITSPEEGILVPVGNVEQLCSVLEALVSDQQTRARLGSAIRESVLKRFAWNRDALAPFLQAT